MGSSRAFVAPTDFGSHSMLHQTLTPSSSCLFAFNPSSSSSSSPSPSFPLSLCPVQPPALTLAFSHCSQVLKEARMETVEAAFKGSSLRPEMLASGPQHHHQQSLLADDERVSFAGDAFSVDDLLDLGEFSEPEKEAERGGKEEDGAGDAVEAENSNNSSSSSSSSALSFEPLPPPSEIPLPAHDAEDLEWVSLYMDDSLSEFATPCSAAAFPAPEKLPVPAVPKLENRPCSALPSPAPCALSTEALVPVKGLKAKRSKRSRSASAAAWSLSGPTHFADSSSSSTATAASSSSSSASSSPFSSFLFYDASTTVHLLDENEPQPKKHKPKKRGRKPKHSPATTTSPAAASSGELRCTHCGAQKTPQWRAGPLGAKTLCNACGVRYKSGRLLPEYRPACSPTFVSSVHSNSHRKVLEMRRKKETDLLSVATPPVPSY